MAAWERSSANIADMQTGYVDRDSIARAGHIASMWSLIDYRNAQNVEESANPMSYRSVARQFDYDCKQKQYRMTAFNYYSGSLATGDIVIGDAHLRRSDWEKVTPHSVEEGLLKIACGRI